MSTAEGTRKGIAQDGLEREQTTQNLSGYSKESCISRRCNRKTLKGSGQQHYMIRCEFQKDHSFHCLQNESKRAQVDTDKQGKETTAMVQVKDNGGSGLERWVDKKGNKIFRK